MASFSIERLQSAFPDNGPFDYEAAKQELDKFDASNPNHVQALCGTGSVNESVLFKILHDPNPKNTLLGHKAIKFIVNTKWQTFGFRMYIEQLLMYALLLMTLTLSVSMDLSQNSKGPYPTQFYVWLNIGTAIFISLIATCFFKYKNLASWTRTLILVIAFALCLLNYFAKSILPHINWAILAYVNCGVLLLTALYFLKFEVDELYGEVAIEHHVFMYGSNMPHLLNRFLFYVLSAPFEIVRQFMYLLIGDARALYFQSNFNCIQLPSFVVLVLFAAAEIIYPFSSSYRLIVGILLAFIMWALSIQYLEVHATAGYLIPMMTALVHDIYRFLAFYAPFQFAYAFAYYLLFQDIKECNDSCHEALEPYSTFSQSFITTYLVMLQQFDTTAFDQLKEEQYVVGYILVLSQGTLVMVMLLNVLVAMLNKSVDGGLEKAKLQAYRSFAECVLRSEKTIGHQDVNAGELSEATPLVARAAASEDEDDEVTMESVAENVAELKNEITENVAELKNEIADLKTLIEALRMEIVSNRN